MNIAVVEDNDSEAAFIRGFIDRYFKEKNMQCKVTVFSDALFFLFGYKPEFDCVFMDIDLPNLNGLDGAKKLRESDPAVPLVFVTSLARYAVKGYGVGALDYLVKPFSYENFALTMDTVCTHTKLNSQSSVTVRNLDGYKVIPTCSIYYVEVRKHRIMYHTDTGIIDVWGSMPSAEAGLPKESFVKCGASWLVNLKNVKSVSGNTVTVGKDILKISRAKKKEFMTALHEYITGKGNN